MHQGRARRRPVTLANASTRFRYHRGTVFSCQGASRAGHPAYRVELTVVRR